MLTSTALILICKYRRMTGKTYQTFCCEHIVNCFFFSFSVIWSVEVQVQIWTKNWEHSTETNICTQHTYWSSHRTEGHTQQKPGQFLLGPLDIRIERKFYCYSTGSRTQSMDVQAGRNAMNGKIYKVPVHGNSDHLSFQLAIFPTVGFLSIWRPRKCTPRNIYRSE